MSENFINKTVMSLRPQAHDIISTWLFYTVARSWLNFKRIPWRAVLISGYVADAKGKKMSKSAGNVVEPQKVIEKYSADAMRLWATNHSVGQDIRYSENEVAAGQKFLIKLWNVARFVFFGTSGIDLANFEEKEIYPSDYWILCELNQLIIQVTKQLEKFDFAQAKITLDKFFWIKLTDNYIELVKGRLYNDSKEGQSGRKSAAWTIRKILHDIILLYAPFAPFITEEIFQEFFKDQHKVKSVHLMPWPTKKNSFNSDDAIKDGNNLIKILSAVRKFKSERKMSIKQSINTLIIRSSNKVAESIKKYSEDLHQATGAKQIKFLLIHCTAAKEKNDLLEIEIKE